MHGDSRQCTGAYRQSPAGKPSDLADRRGWRRINISSGCLLPGTGRIADAADDNLGSRTEVRAATAAGQAAGGERRSR
jgi:hypothetical protein